jgi:uncharacterized protein Yka (UPF0111/DUF47 family)
MSHAAQLVRELVARWPDDRGLLDDIVAAEHEGDRIAHAILRRLAERGSSLDAADVHALACALDDIVDYAEEAADRLSLYRVEATMDQAVAIADVLVLAAGEVVAALAGLCDGDDLTRRLIESTGSRTRRTGSSARRWRRCSSTASTRWR